MAGSDITRNTDWNDFINFSEPRKKSQIKWLGVLSVGSDINIEELTGLDFLTNLSAELEQCLEKEQDLSLWNFNTKAKTEVIQ